MSSETESLRNLYLEVAGEETITERQEEEPSRDPIGADETELEQEVSALLRQDGLEDAVESGDIDAGTP